MIARAARLHNKKDIRIDDFVLPNIKNNQILIKVISNSLCMSTYKAAMLGKDHKRVPDNIEEKPAITGHEFAGEIVEIGEMWKDKYKIGDKVVIQPALYYDGKPYAPGYSYEYFGGNTTYTIVPWEYIEYGCVIKYSGDFFANASLAEPMSCIIGAFHANYHTKPFIYEHEMGIKENGNLALLAAAGPMGLGALDYILHCNRRPKKVAVVDINEDRLDLAQKVLTVEHAKEIGIALKYINPSKVDDEIKKLMDFSEGNGYDDVYVFAPVKKVIELGDEILSHDGCLNFFAGPIDKKFKADFNFYNVHYGSTHIVGTSGGSTDDMKESIEMSAKNIINPTIMVTHVGGLNVVPDTIINLPNIPGGKKLIYPHIEMPLINIKKIEEYISTDNRFKELAKILDKTNRLWSLEAEKYVIEKFATNNYGE